MTEDEINRKVAEIEGARTISAYRAVVRKHATDGGKHRRTLDWEQVDAPPPYATDWAWCGPLVEKYTMAVDLAVRWMADTPGWLAVQGDDCFEDATPADTPQQAICLAVIALKT